MTEMAQVDEMESRQEVATSNPGDAGSNPALSPRIVGAIYDDGALQLGCLVCGETILPKLAKSRSKTCGEGCAKTLRYMRDRDNLVPQYLTMLRQGKISPEKVMQRLVQLQQQPPKRTLLCQVCRQQIPAVTAERMSVTCGKDCRNELRRYRMEVLKNQKCPHCYHPCTPEEWTEWRQWRAERGPMQAFMQLPGRGNPTGKREKALREALGDAVGVLRGELGVILVSYASERIDGLPIRSSLNADGEALAVPLEKIIERAQELLEPRKKFLDIGNAE